MSVDLLLHLRLLLDQRVEVGIRLGECRRDRLEAVEQVAQVADAVLDVAADVLGRVEVGLLLEEADGRSGAQLGGSARCLLAAGHQAQQRRLAGAVWAEDTDLRSWKECERDLVEHLAIGAVELRRPDHREDVVRHPSKEASCASTRQNR